MATIYFPPGQWTNGSITSPRKFLDLLHFTSDSTLKYLRRLASSPDIWDEDPVHLESYLRYTILRLLEENKILTWSTATGRINSFLFNTGLVTAIDEAIFGIFIPVVLAAKTHYHLLAYVTTPHQARSWNYIRNNNYGTPLAAPPPYDLLPPKANYPVTTLDQSYINNILYDRDLSLAHILGTEAQNLSSEDTQHRRDRLPEAYRDVRRWPIEKLAAHTKIVIHQALASVAANLTTAIPQFFWDHNAEHSSIQFLLPLTFDLNSEKPDCVAVMMDSKIVSVLSLLWARRNARVIGPLENTWLAYRPNPTTPSPTIFVKNLPADTTEEDLAHHFEPNRPKTVRFIRSDPDIRSPYCHAVLTFADQEQADFVMKNFQRYVFDGRTIELDWYKSLIRIPEKIEPVRIPEKIEPVRIPVPTLPFRYWEKPIEKSSVPKRLFVSNLPYSITRAQLEELFAPYKPAAVKVHLGRVTNAFGATYKSIGSADVTFTSTENTNAAMAALDQKTIGGRLIKIVPYAAKN